MISSKKVSIALLTLLKNSQNMLLNDKGKRKQFPIPYESLLMTKSCLSIISKGLSQDQKDRPSFKEILNEIRSISYSLTNGIDQKLRKIDNY